MCSRHFPVVQLPVVGEVGEAADDERPSLGHCQAVSQEAGPTEALVRKVSW